MSTEKKERPTFEFHFHGNVGQQIANVERMEVRFDKDMNMQVSNVENMEQKAAIPPKPKSEKSSLPKITRKSKQEQEKPRELMTFTKRGILSENVKMLYSQMVESKWIDAMTPEQDFLDLFSGELSQCKIIWAGKYGKGTLVFLFQYLEQEEVISVPKGYTIPNILMGHFVDKEDHFLTNLDNGDPANDKAGKEMLAFVNTLHTTAHTIDSKDYSPSGYGDAINPYELEKEGLRYRGNKHGSGRNSGIG